MPGSQGLTLEGQLWVRTVGSVRWGADNQLPELIQAVSPGTNFSKRCNHSNFLRGCRCCCIRLEKQQCEDHNLGNHIAILKQWPAQ